jgi:hypothetical protein
MGKHLPKGSPALSQAKKVESMLALKGAKFLTFLSQAGPGYVIIECSTAHAVSCQLVTAGGLGSNSGQ